MKLFEAIVLGIVQGLTEFLPVSSSGHLAVVNYALGREIFGEDLIFIVAVHLASAIAAFAYFYKRIIALFRAGNRRTLALIVTGSIPAAVAGLLFKKLGIIEKAGALEAVAVCFFVTAALLKLSDLGREKGFELRDAGWKNSLLVGLGQAAGLMPGISRSGATISAGMLAGLKRREAVEFSFFLAIPAIVGANILEAFWKISSGKAIVGGVELLPVAAGFLASLVVSLICIKILVILVRRRFFSAFAYYCIAAGIATIILILVM